VNCWRRKAPRFGKGFVVTSGAELLARMRPLLSVGVDAIAQEIVQGPDTNHFKYCAYFSRDGRSLLGFTLGKIRQQPPRFGVGSIVESIDYPELKAAGEQLFSAIGYRGVGSAEFKLDSRDGRLKLIEINPRYWQQISLPTACGMNFPLADYLECTGRSPKGSTRFVVGMKWISPRLDHDAFVAYRQAGELSFIEWRRSRRGEKIYSVYARDDPMPRLREWASSAHKQLKRVWGTAKRIALVVSRKNRHKPA
jgi:D-aspartate ligase